MAKRKRSSRRPHPKHKKHKKSQHVLQAVPDGRIAFRLAIVVAGMFLAGDRRPASACQHQSA